MVSELIGQNFQLIENARPNRGRSNSRPTNGNSKKYHQHFAVMSTSVNQTPRNKQNPYRSSNQAARPLKAMTYNKVNNITENRSRNNSKDDFRGSPVRPQLAPSHMQQAKISINTIEKSNSGTQKKLRNMLNHSTGRSNPYNMNLLNTSSNSGHVMPPSNPNSYRLNDTIPNEKSDVFENFTKLLGEPLPKARATPTKQVKLQRLPPSRSAPQSNHFQSQKSVPSVDLGAQISSQETKNFKPPNQSNKIRTQISGLHSRRNTFSKMEGLPGREMSTSFRATADESNYDLGGHSHQPSLTLTINNSNEKSPEKKQTIHQKYQSLMVRILRLR